jgi:Fe-S-cluster containining protein
MSTFVTFYRLTDFEPPVDESDERFFRTKYGKLALGLSQVDLPGNELGCVFLKDNLCSIHTFKPYVCGQYPFLPQDPDNMDGPFKLVDNPCFGKHATDETVDERPVRRNYRIFHEKQAAYNRKVQEWNEDAGSEEKGIEDYLTFVGLEWN